MPTINFPPFDHLVNPKFASLFENKDRYILSWGGRNGSRSSSWAIILIYRCLLHKYFRCILIRKTFASIKDSQYETIKDFVDDLGLSSMFTFKVSPLEIICVNGNKFICRGMDKVEKLKSLKDYTCAWYEEGNQITEKDFITVTTTIRSLKADFLQEIFTFNPETEEHYEDFWLWKKFFRGHSEYNFRHKTVTTFKLHGVKKVVESWYTSQHSTYKDNRYLDDAQIAIVEELKEANPYYYTVFTLGHWGNKEVSDKFWKGFNRIRHVRDDIFLDIDKPIHICFDENVNPYPALTIWQFDEIDETRTEGGLTPKKIDVRQIHEICLTNPNNKLKKVVRELVRWLTVQGWINMIYIYGDASSKKEDTKLEEGMNYFTMFRDALLIEGYKVRIKKSAKNPPVAMSAEFINECYESNFGGIHISISSSCKESVNDYLLVQEKTDGTMKKPKNSDGVELLGHCFVGDTLIETDQGAIKIKDVKVGDMVLTRSGYKKVLLSHLTKRGAKVNDYAINGNVLTCTPDHTIYTEKRGFIPACELIHSDTFCILEEWNLKKYFTTESSFPEALPENKVTPIITQDGQMVKRKHTYTGINGNVKGGQFLKAMKSIMQIKTLSTTTFQTMNAFLQKSTRQGTKRILGIIHLKVKPILRRFKNWLRYGIDQKRVRLGIGKTGKIVLARLSQLKYNALYVILNIWDLSGKAITFVPTIVNPHTVESQELIMKQGNVSFVEANLYVTNILKLNVVQRLVVPSTERYKDVYNLKVEHCPEFFANNVLVHNCSDTKRYLISEAFKDQFKEYIRRRPKKGKTHHIISSKKGRKY